MRAMLEDSRKKVETQLDGRNKAGDETLRCLDCQSRYGTKQNVKLVTREEVQQRCVVDTEHRDTASCAAADDFRVSADRLHLTSLHFTSLHCQQRPSICVLIVHSTASSRDVPVSTPQTNKLGKNHEQRTRSAPPSLSFQVYSAKLSHFETSELHDCVSVMGAQHLVVLKQRSILSSMALCPP